MERLRVLHMITSVGIGGAQTMLAKLLEQRGAGLGDLDQSVLSLMPPGELAPRIEAAGVPIHSTGARSAIPTPGALVSLIRTTRALRPDLVIGWMHHGATAAYHASKMLPRRPGLIFNVRHSLSDMAHEKPISRMLLRHNAGLSGDVDAVIYNSHVSRKQYAEHGYDDSKAVVIANGFDLTRFRPDTHARARLGRLFGIPDGRTVVGMIARWHPMKDPATLIAAMKPLWEEGRDLHLLFVGTGMDRLRDDLGSAFDGIAEDRVTLAGQRLDVGDWLAGLDLAVLPSAWGEGFPNVLGEAMACGVPCVATDIGDSRWVVGEEGWIVPPRDPQAMQAAIARFLDLSDTARDTLRGRARRRVEENFSIQAVAADYARLYERVLAGVASPAASGLEAAA